MPDTDTIPAEELLRMTSEVAAAYVSNNNLPSGQLPDVIRTIHESAENPDKAAAGQSRSSLPRRARRFSVIREIRYVIDALDSRSYPGCSGAGPWSRLR